MYAAILIIYLPEHVICSPAARHRRRRFFIQVFISYVLIMNFIIYNENPFMQPNNIYINYNKKSICSPAARHRLRRFFIQVFISYVLILNFISYNENL